MGLITVEVTVRGDVGDVTRSKVPVWVEEDDYGRATALGVNFNAQRPQVVVYTERRRGEGVQFRSPTVLRWSVAGKKTQVPLVHILHGKVGQGLRARFVDGNRLNLSRGNVVWSTAPATRKKKATRGPRHEIREVTRYELVRVEGSTEKVIAAASTREGALVTLGALILGER